MATGAYVFNRIHAREQDIEAIANRLTTERDARVIRARTWLSKLEYAVYLEVCANSDIPLIKKTAVMQQIKARTARMLAHTAARLLRP